MTYLHSLKKLALVFLVGAGIFAPQQAKAEGALDIAIGILSELFTTPDNQSVSAVSPSGGSISKNIAAEKQSTVSSEDTSKSLSSKDTSSKKASNVPKRAWQVLKTIRETGKQPDDVYSGGRFQNRERLLPRTDAAGDSITYMEYDVNPYKKGVNRGAERIVVGSDGRAYYTSDHYSSFTLME